MAASRWGSVTPSEAGEPIGTEYRVYVSSILKPLEPAALARRTHPAEGGRAVLERALLDFVRELRFFVTGWDDRKLSKAALRRARGIEAQLAARCEHLLVNPLLQGILQLEDLHGIWHGFAAVRGWRDSKVPQDCFLQMLRGALSLFGEAAVEAWNQEALTCELTLPEVHQSISVSAWPSLCELLGRLPDCVTAAELQEALWQQSFVENPTHAPDHRNYRRFALLAAQMVQIGVELDSEKVELLVQQTLDLDRPWRERRDVLSGILSAASVEDRQTVVRKLDRRFQEHADIDDFEIVCGIAEHIGIEVPRDGAIRRCALRRWALDPKRGGALPVARLIDFVDMDATIGEDVAANLRQKGRVADAALLLSRLDVPYPSSMFSGDSVGMLDVNNGHAELARLRELLCLDDDLGSHNFGGRGVFGPIEELGAFRLPMSRLEDVGFAELADAAADAVKRLSTCTVLVVGLWREEAPFWHAPATLVALCTDRGLELLDLPALRRDESGQWAEVANGLRALLLDPHVLKIAFGEDVLQAFSYALGLGIAATLRRGEKSPFGPVLDMRGLMADLLGRSADDPECAWPALARRFLGVRLCPEEAGSNWGRRPLRESQLHHAAAEAWTQLPVLRAICAHGLVPRALVLRHLVIQSRLRPAAARKTGGKVHVVGQLAPPGRLSDPALYNGGAGLRQLFDRAASQPAAPLSPATRVAVLHAGSGALPSGTVVEVFEEAFGGLACVAPLGSGGATDLIRVPVDCLQGVNPWEYPAWVSALPRPTACTVDSLANNGTLVATGGAESVLAVESPRPAARGAAPPDAGSCRASIAKELVEDLFDKKAANELLAVMYAAQPIVRSPLEDLRLQ